MEEQDKLVDVAVEGSGVQEIEALIVGEQRVRAMLKQEVYDVIVASLSGPEDGCCDSVSSFSVDVCAALYQEMAQGVVVVDRGPLSLLTCRLSRSAEDTHVERCNALLILVRSVVLPVIKKLLDRRDFPQPRQLHNVVLERQIRFLVGHVFEFVLARGLRVRFGAL